MSDFEPKEIPSRKAAVFRGARERIVDTDERLGATTRNLDREKHAHRATASERDLFKSVINDPQKKQFLESLHRQIGAELADAAFQEMIKALGVTQRVVIERLYEIADAAGDGVALHICREMERCGVIDTKAYDRPDFDRDSVAVMSIVEIPPVKLRYTKMHSRR